jgi:hypothetical protein
MWVLTNLAFVFSCLIAALTPIFALSYFLAPNRHLGLQNVLVSAIPAWLGMSAGSEVYFRALGPTPPLAAYLIVGAWAGSACAVPIITLIRCAFDRRRFAPRRSLRMSLLFVAGLCALLGAVRFVWCLDWATLGW